MQIELTWEQFEILKRQIALIQNALSLGHTKGEAVSDYEVKWDKLDNVVFELPD